MKLQASAVVEVAKSREIVWEYCSKVEHVPDYVRGYGPIPGVAKAWNPGGVPTKLGVVRRLVMTDGVPLDEEITVFEAPRKFAYVLKGFRGAFSLLVSKAEGQWVFSPLGEGTRISWTFTAHLKSPLVLGIGYPLIKVFMQRSMEDALANIRRTLA